MQQELVILSISLYVQTAASDNFRAPLIRNKYRDPIPNTTVDTYTPGGLHFELTVK